MELHPGILIFNRFFLLFGKVHLGLKRKKCCNIFLVTYSALIIILSVSLAIMKSYLLVIYKPAYEEAMQNFVPMLISYILSSLISIGFFITSFKYPLKVSNAKFYFVFQLSRKHFWSICFLIIFISLCWITSAYSLIPPVLSDFEECFRPYIAGPLLEHTFNQTFPSCFYVVETTFFYGLIYFPCMISPCYLLLHFLVMAQAFENFNKDIIVKMSDSIHEYSAQHIER